MNNGFNKQVNMNGLPKCTVNLGVTAKNKQCCEGLLHNCEAASSQHKTHPCLCDMISEKSRCESTFQVGSPKSLPSLSPTSRRRRLKNITKHNIDSLLGTSPPKVVAHMPRDPVQPRSGSISDVHSEASMEDEEIDFFSDEIPFRPRSHTCPENRSWQRKVKVRHRNRPLTPPPGGAHDNEIEHHLQQLSIKERLKIPLRDLPSCIWENPSDKDQEENVGSLDNICDEEKEDTDIFTMDDH